MKTTWRQPRTQCTLAAGSLTMLRAPTLPLVAARIASICPVPHRLSASRRLLHSPSELRSYQEECLTRSIDALERGIKRQIISLPVASGKTTIFANLIPRIPSPTPEASKILVLAHKTELIQQALATFKRCLPASEYTFDVEEGRKKARDTSNVIIASVNTLGRKASERLLEPRFHPSNFKAIIIDEAHHAAAETYARILRHFGADKKDTHLLVWGCSATIRRHDGLALTNAFDELVYHRTTSQMIEDKWLCDMKFHRIVSDTNLNGLPERAGDFAAGPLSQRVDNPARNLQIFHAWWGMSQEKKIKTTLIFATSVDHIQSLCEVFKRHGVAVRGVHGGTPSQERKETLDAFGRGDFPVLINCGIVAEGVDIPAIDGIVLARPTRSLVLLQQMLGRGLRPYPGKSACWFIDVCDSVDTDTALASPPALLGLAREFDFEDRPISEVMKKLEGIHDSDRPLHMCKSWADVEAVAADDVNPTAEGEPARYGFQLQAFDSPYRVEPPNPLNDLHDETQKLKQMSRFAWVRVGSLECLLKLPNHSWLTATAERDGSFHVHHHRRHKTLVQSGTASRFKYFHTKHHIVTQDTLAWAIRSADTYVSQRSELLGRPGVLLRTAPWRKMPPSAAQVHALQDLKIKFDGNVADLTKGEAADLLTKRLHGAKGRREEADMRRLKKKEEREEKTNNRVQWNTRIRFGATV
ncbi:hypothetical protein HDU89_006354 [Geranomyces variabilis]|nr:hypothetical protein HDU89_006354 [Geranomyces variabilis]